MRFTPTISRMNLQILNIENQKLQLHTYNLTVHSHGKDEKSTDQKTNIRHCLLL